MRVEATSLAGVFVIEPKVFEDPRGCFFESFNHAAFEAAIGQRVSFVQDNHSVSRGPVLRGLHYQAGRPQGKLVRVVAGSIFDVAVDIRPGSPTRGRWCGMELSAENRRQLYVPRGFAHGFCVLSEGAGLAYKVTAEYAPDLERGIRWDDPQIGIQWPIADPVLSPRDAQLPALGEADNDFEF